MGEVVFLTENSGILYVFLNGLNAAIFRILLMYLRYKMVVQDFTGWKPNLVFAGELFEEVRKFSYPRNCIIKC